MHKRLLLVIFVLAVLLLPSIYARADGPNIQMQAVVGFDGYYKIGQWIPISVDVENKGQDFNGQLQAICYQDQSSDVIFSTPAVIPAGSKKRLTLYGKIGMLQKSMDIRLVQGSNVIKAIKVDKLSPISPTSHMLGILTDDKAALNYWWGKLPNEYIFSDYEAVALAAERLSDRAEVLKNLSVLIINNYNTSTLSQRQLEAIDEWVKSGGVLIVGTGPNGYKVLSGINGIVHIKAGDINELADVSKIETMAGQSLSADVKLQLMDIKAPAGQIVLAQDDRGLVWIQPKGAGYIFVSAFDLGLSPFANWSGSKLFWDNLLMRAMDAQKSMQLRPNGANMFAFYGPDPYSSIQQALQSIKAMDLPSISNLILLLVAYMVIIGPLGYFALKKLDKREWMWFIVPISALAFAVIIYVLGYTAKGAEVVTNTITFVDMHDGSGASSARSYVGIFIPRRGDYTVEVDGNTLVSLGASQSVNAQWQASDDRQRTVKASVLQSQTNAMTLYDANVWTMQVFTLDGPMPPLGEIKADLAYCDGKITGMLLNNTGYALDEVVLFTPYGYQAIKDLASGQSKPVEFDINTRNTYDIYYILDKLYSSPYGGPNPMSKVTDEQREQWAKRSIMESVLMPNMPFLKLIAFSHQGFANGIKVNGQLTDTAYSHSVFTEDIDLSFEKDGILDVPSGVIQPVFIPEGSSSASLMPPKGISIENGSAILAFNLSSFKDFDITDIELTVPAYDPNRTQMLIYDNLKKEYIDVAEEGMGNLRFNQADVGRFVDDMGWLKLKIVSKDSSGIGLQIPDIAIKGVKR